MKKIRQQLLLRRNLVRHIKTALLVGIILNIINQQHLIWGFGWHELEIPRMVLTFFVPFSVSVYSAATSNPVNNQESKEPKE